MPSEVMNEIKVRIAGVSKLAVKLRNLFLKSKASGFEIKVSFSGNP